MPKPYQQLDSYFRKRAAVPVSFKDIGTGKWPTDRAVWFESANFGWILGPMAPKRKILVKY